MANNKLKKAALMAGIAAATAMPLTSSARSKPKDAKEKRVEFIVKPNTKVMREKARLFNVYDDSLSKFPVELASSSNILLDDVKTLVKRPGDEYYLQCLKRAVPRYENAFYRQKDNMMQEYLCLRNEITKDLTNPKLNKNIAKEKKRLLEIYDEQFNYGRLSCDFEDASNNLLKYVREVIEQPDTADYEKLKSLASTFDSALYKQVERIVRGSLFVEHEITKGMTYLFEAKMCDLYYAVKEMYEEIRNKEKIQKKEQETNKSKMLFKKCRER